VRRPPAVRPILVGLISFHDVSNPTGAWNLVSTRACWPRNKIEQTTAGGYASETKGVELVCLMPLRPGTPCAWRQRRPAPRRLHRGASARAPLTHPRPPHLKACQVPRHIHSTFIHMKYMTDARAAVCATCHALTQRVKGSFSSSSERLSRQTGRLTQKRVRLELAGNTFVRVVVLVAGGQQLGVRREVCLLPLLFELRRELRPLCHRQLQCATHTVGTTTCDSCRAKWSCLLLTRTH
jgi:hypothetical protein